VGVLGGVGTGVDSNKSEHLLIKLLFPGSTSSVLLLDLLDSVGVLLYMLWSGGLDGGLSYGE
jgi:hypothetical protein